MAISQLDDDTETVEEALARANAEAKAKRNAPKPGKYPCQHCGYAGPCEIDLDDVDALRTLAKGALAEIVQRAPRNVSLVAAIRELLDRVEGRAPQNINMQVTQSPISLLSDDRLERLLAALDEPILIVGPPK